MNTTETNSIPSDDDDLYQLAIPPATAWALAMGLQKDYDGHVLSNDERKVLATIVLGGVIKSGPEHLLIGIRLSVRTQWPDIDWDGIEKDILETHSTS